MLTEFTCPYHVCVFPTEIWSPSETMHVFSFVVYFLLNFSKFMLSRHVTDYPTTNNSIFSIEKDLWLYALCLS